VKGIPPDNANGSIQSSQSGRGLVRLALKFLFGIGSRGFGDAGF